MNINLDFILFYSKKFNNDIDFLFVNSKLDLFVNYRSL